MPCSLPPIGPIAIAYHWCAAEGDQAPRGLLVSRYAAFPGARSVIEGLDQILAHSRATWNKEYYWTEPFGDLSLDGRFLAFTSGRDNQVGTVGDHPRTDVWIVKLK